MESSKFSIYYDGLCPLCSKEINHYRRVDVDQRIDFVNISNPSFNASAIGLDPKKVQKVFHIKNTSGKIVTGVDAFIAIWEFLEIFKPLSSLAKNRLIRPFFDMGYIVFAKVRPVFRKNECANGQCEIS